MNDIELTIEMAQSLGIKVDTLTKTVKPLTAEDFHGRSDKEIEQIGQLLAALALHGYSERTEH